MNNFKLDFNGETDTLYCWTISKYMSEQKHRLRFATSSFIQIASIGIPSKDGLTSRNLVFAVGLLIVLLQSLVLLSVSAWSQENPNATAVVTRAIGRRQGALRSAVRT